MLEATLIEADLAVPGVRGFVTTRAGGVSTGPWGAGDEQGGLNLGLGSGDAPERVRANRERVSALLSQPPRWLRQVHGATVVDAEGVGDSSEADASTSVTPGVVCAVLVADCLPVLLASRNGRGVAAVHAGWRGLAGGVIQNTVQRLRERLCDPRAPLVAWLGPAIGPDHFEVGPEVLAAMQARLPDAQSAFVSTAKDKFHADLFKLARLALGQAGVDCVGGGGDCTFADGARFYSFRRDRVTGRHAALVWINSEPRGKTYRFDTRQWLRTIRRSGQNTSPLLPRIDRSTPGDARMASVRGARSTEPAAKTRARKRVRKQGEERVATPVKTKANGEAKAEAANGVTTNWLAGLDLTQFAPRQIPQIGLSAERLLELQQTYAQRLSSLWQDFAAHPERPPEPIRDNRFADPAWQKNSWASFYARAYLLNAEFMNQLAESVQADRKTKQRVKFAVSQWVDAASPSNFLALNPQAQQRLLATKGESLTSGLANLLKDIGKGKISQTDETAFEVGRNVATSEGAVVYENRLMQLIQYKPLTAQVHRRPFVMVPPCINKFYILDLQPENSFIRYAVEQGNTVFVVSWKNPHQPEAKMTWDDYLELGPIAALGVVREITGEKQVNLLGFCVGGTIVAAALAIMRARGDDPVASLTLLTALLDFEETGLLDIFVDEAHVRMREQTLGAGGLMPGLELANTFSSLRANDLVWNYVVSNYLEGKAPPAFDLLYWNGDSTNLPGPMYAWYLRNTYLENNLRVPNKLVCCGERVDLNRISVPAFVFAAKEDHIVPWKAAYASARLLPGDKPGGVHFVLGASGHIAGTINPVSKNKRSFWTAPDGALPANSEAWLANAQEHPGSWWADWNRWLRQYSGGETAAPKKLGNQQYAPIEPAPGRYVKEKA